MTSKARLVINQAHYKDAQLDRIADSGNVAQFVSFSPSLECRFSRVTGYRPNSKFKSPSEALQAVLERSAEKRINVRSFLPDDPQGHEFIYGLTSAQDALEHINRFTSSGLFVIANETVDVNDGGVSGVVHGNVIEFAPGATPRVVETGDVVSVRRQVGEKIIATVYGTMMDVPSGENLRTEFSIHPLPRGYKQEHTIVWELQRVDQLPQEPSLHWPNRFSELIGDKAFGLLLAHCAGLYVPHTQVLARQVAPFCFGTKTGSKVMWLRTCPRRAEPGLFPTVRGWTDPFQLIERTPGGERIASILVQHEVQSKFSGALLTGSDGQPIIEGVVGFGDDFMLGRIGATNLPSEVDRQLRSLYDELTSTLGSVRAEWAFDGGKVWLLQLQQEKAVSLGQVVVPGDVEEEVDFDVSTGIAGLRELVRLLEGRNVGIRLTGNVGMTSHIADILRRSEIPSRIVLE